ncbi:MAG TPA: hypothetical protein VLR71_08730 [Casimicrobiaceae bacterium]|nr:hypothetical protein [Casimicrobiaceae bacterium]
MMPSLLLMSSAEDVGDLPPVMQHRDAIGALSVRQIWVALRQMNM